MIRSTIHSSRKFAGKFELLVINFMNKFFGF
jgi:hypothetical protein